VESARLQSQNNRILDIFLVSDMESNTAIPENKWPYVKDRILAKLKRRKIVNTSHDDPKLVEQVTFLISTLDKVVQADGQAQVVEAALLLQNGFEQLRNKEDPRKRADLLRYIEKMEEPLVCPYCLNIE
jgi:hypothetical protein